MKTRQYVTHRLHQRCQVLQGQLGEVPEHHAALEGLSLHRLVAVLHTVHRLGMCAYAQQVAGVKEAENFHQTIYMYGRWYMN